MAFSIQLQCDCASAIDSPKNNTGRIRTIFRDCLFAKARKIDVVSVSVNVKIVYTRAEMIHELPQGPRRNGPVVRCILGAKFGVHWGCNLKGQAVSGSQATPEDYASNEAALDAFTIFNGNVAFVNQGLLLSVSLVVGGRATAEQRYERLCDKD